MAMAAEISLGELAERFSLELRGDRATKIRGVGSLAHAQQDQLAFLTNAKYLRLLATTRAAAVVLSSDAAGYYTGSALVADHPHASFARIAALFERTPASKPGVHPTAVIDATAHVDPGAFIGPFCVVGPRSRVEAGAELGAHCAIGQDCVVGAQTRLMARVTLVQDVRIGKRVLVQPGAVIGADGFGLVFDAGAWVKVPHLGGVRIGDDCEIGANTTIDRGALDDTVLDEDVRLDNLIQIGHNVQIGAHTAMAACVGVAGSTRIGRHCLIAGAVGIAGHLDICDRVTITGMSLVSHSIREPGEYSSGMPIQDSRQWRRTVARLRQLDRRGVRRSGRAAKDETP
jgi:UDP-3-O-[3-hydroxymyristoyl] glucosamine N-acyltransferase